MVSTVVEVNGRNLSLSPTNIGMDDLARRCNKGRTSYVILEPGDATRYEIYLVPFKNPRLRMSGTSSNFVLVAMPNVGTYPFNVSGPVHLGYIVEKLGLKGPWGQHTAGVISSFLLVLGQWMDDLKDMSGEVED